MILDATCGLKEMWFEKNDPETIYLDLRRGKIEYPQNYINVRPEIVNHEIRPTIQADNRYLPFKDNVFDLVIFDPPHIIQTNPTGIMGIRYTTLKPITWTIDMSKTIKELFRVLKPKGFLIFKWNEHSAAVRIALRTFRPRKPLFGTSNSNTKTWWIVFRK